GNSGLYEYATADHLGSPRAWTDDTGPLIAGGRHDYLPFGEELSAGVGIRSAGLGYGADSARQKFTGKERDDEIGLDYFLARHYSNVQGRFTSSDPYNINFEKERGRNEQEREKFFISYISQPQNWNKYAYTLNNPLKYSDPDGRRTANADDIRRLDILNCEYLAALQAGDNDRAAEFLQAMTDLRTAIKAAPDDPAYDPATLKAAFWPIDRIGSTAYSFNASHSNGQTVDAASKTNKCNIFVAEAYAIGANAGFGGYPELGVPTSFSFSHPLSEGNVPTANDLANKNVDISNFPVVGGAPRIGALAAFGNPDSSVSGHVGVVV